MDGYDAVNNEIKSFLALAENQPKEIPKDTVNQDIGKEENIVSLLELLKNIQTIYGEINVNLISGNNEGIRNTLLGSDIKMSLVCESLMNVLKDVSQEKREMVLNEEKCKERLKKLREEKEDLEIRMNRVESDLEFASRGNQELNRIIKDQRNSIQAFKEKAELEKRNCDSFRSISTELEVLRKKSLERCHIYEKEIGVLKEHVKEKTEDAKRMRSELKQTETERGVLGERILSMEKSIELLRKKLDMKENALGLCNSELSKLISKEKRMDAEFEGLKEKASYYERLYKATNSQNEYLNGQLARMINKESSVDVKVPEYDPEAKEETSVLSEVKKNGDASTIDEAGYLKKLRRYRQKVSEQKRASKKLTCEVEDLLSGIKNLKEENCRLQEEKVEAVSKSTKMMDELVGKVEKLLERNRSYQNIICDLKNEKQMVSGEKRARVEVTNNFDESFKTVNDGGGHWPEVRKDGLFMNYGNFMNDLQGARSDLKPFKLENEYEDESAKQGDGNDNELEKRLGNYRVSNIHSRLGFPEKENVGDKNVPGADSIKLSFPDSFYTSLVSRKEKYEKLVPAEAMLDNGHGCAKMGTKSGVGETNGSKFGENSNRKDLHIVDPFDSTPSIKHTEEVIDKNERSSDSMVSPKTVCTTSTLHEMLKKTGALQEKFNVLENQLNLIKESDKAEVEKIHDQVRAYKNYYYSDYLDTSNEFDFI